RVTESWPSETVPSCWFGMSYNRTLRPATIEELPCWRTSLTMQGKGYRSLWAAALIFASCWGDLVKAADLGGNCCADLEERVADLEATTAEKGNRKVTVTLYGRVNRIVNFWDDGAETNTYTLNSSYSPSRWGFRGDAKIGRAWTSGYTLEMED